MGGASAAPPPATLMRTASPVVTSDATGSAPLVARSVQYATAVRMDPRSLPQGGVPAQSCAYSGASVGRPPPEKSDR